MLTTYASPSRVVWEYYDQCGLVSAGDQFGQIARRFDLAVVGQAEPETKMVEENIIEAALFDSGGAGYHRSLHSASAAQAGPHYGMLGQ
jgi:hypothetical protein